MSEVPEEASAAMEGKELHFSDEELLLSAEGELPQNRIRQIRFALGSLPNVSNTIEWGRRCNKGFH